MHLGKSSTVTTKAVSGQTFLYIAKNVLFTLQAGLNWTAYSTHTHLRCKAWKLWVRSHRQKTEWAGRSIAKYDIHGTALCTLLDYNVNAYDSETMHETMPNQPSRNTFPLRPVISVSRIASWTFSRGKLSPAKQQTVSAWSTIAGHKAQMRDKGVLTERRFTVSHDCSPLKQCNLGRTVR